MLGMIQKLQHQVVQTYTALAELSSDEPASGGRGRSGLAGYDALASTGTTTSNAKSGASGAKKKTKKKAETTKPSAAEKKKQQQLQPVIQEDDSSPLTLQEQEFLTETIPALPPDNLHGVIQIIREAAKLTGEEDEIDLEIDQLDTSTQRKLLKYVSKVSKENFITPYVDRHISILISSIQFLVFMFRPVCQAETTKETGSQKGQSF